MPPSVGFRTIVPPTALPVSGTGRQLSSTARLLQSILLLTSLFLSSDLSAQWINTQTNSVYHLAMTSPDTGYACGFGGLVKKTYDAGGTWTFLETGITDELNAIRFPHPTVGYAAGANGTVIKTSNSGCLWQRLSLPTTATINGLAFADSATGWAVTASGQILKTANSGASWTIQAAPPGANFFAVSCAGAQDAVACGNNGILFVTHNGGATWIPASTGFTGPNLAVKMIDPATIIMCNDPNGVFKSTNGGITWTRVLTGFGYYAVDFQTPSYGIVAGYQGRVMKTLDGGATWTQMNSNGLANSIPYTLEFLDVQLIGTTGFLSARPGTILRLEPTADIDWRILSSGARYYHRRLRFATDDVAYATGLGNFVRSTDAGKTWNFASYDPLQLLCGISFRDNNNGLAAGYYGTIMKTSNAGASWHAQNTGTTAHLENIKTVGPLKAWAVGENGTILYSGNGGTSWTQQVSGTTFRLYGIDFADEQTGWVVGMRTILKTTNGGASWTTLVSNTDHYYWSAVFTDANTGWVCGNEFSTGNGFILKTTDGGATWTRQFTTTTLFKYPTSITAAGGQLWACGDMGAVYHSADGGATWTEQVSGTTARLRQIVFTDAQNGTCVGSDATVLSTTNGGATWTSHRGASGDDFFSVAVRPTGIYWCGAIGQINFTPGNLTDEDAWVSQVRSMNYVDNAGAFQFIDADKGWIALPLNLTGWYVYNTVNGGRSWKAMSHIANYGSDTMVTDIQFKTPLIGFGTLSNGMFMRTGDGGKTWTYRHTPIGNEALKTLDFYDATNGFMVGENGLMVSTFDGGLTHTSAYHPSGETFFKVKMVSPDHIWMASGTKLLYSGDRGFTWQVRTPPGVTAVYDIAFLDEQTGWVLGTGNFCYTTTDGGATWTQARIELGVFLNEQYYSLTFNRRREGIALCEGMVSILKGLGSSSVNAAFTVDTLDFCARKLRLTAKNSYPGAQYSWLVGTATYSGSPVDVTLPATPSQFPIRLSIRQQENGPCSSIVRVDTTYSGIQFDSIPTPAFEVALLCEKRQAQFTNRSTGTDAFTTYRWSFGDGATGTTVAPTHQYAQAIPYDATLVAVSKNGCASLPVTVPVVPKEPATANAGPDLTVSPGVPFQLTGCCGGSYLWSPAGPLDQATLASPTGRLQGDTTFRLTVTAATGCTATDDVSVKVFKEPRIYVPTAFTPDGNGHNDLLHAFPIGLKLVDFKVFNRWGEMVFETTDPARGWNGTWRGKRQGTNNFVWLAVGELADGSRIMSKGNVLLLR
ncbi:MAG: hypothetical protein JWP27_5 [Flaviaesturariibacter sp.]|nr:hypothetical protein [Flaviaesturariibacter sp.]